jgi:hypothetical protein
VATVSAMGYDLPFTAEALLEVGRAEIGVHEDPPGSNKVKYNEWAGLQGQPWCVTLWRWCIFTAGGGKPPFSAFNPAVKTWAQKNGVWVAPSETPQPGDFILYAFPHEDHVPNHFGIVEKVRGIADVDTIEGNCLPVETPVLTPFGWKPIGELRPGDSVVDPEGQPSSVVAIYHRGRQQVFNVDTGFGSVEATADHLWKVRLVGTGKDAVLTTSQIRERVERGQRIRLPEITPPDLDSGGMRFLDPWLLGYLIGDGSLSRDGCCHFTTVDPEIVEKVRSSLPEGHEARDNGDGTWRIVSTGSKNLVLREIRELGLACTAPHKFVPDAYRWAPAKDRLEVLRGLLDSDGHVDASGRIEFCSVSETLARDVQFLVRSLGGKCGVNRKPRVFYTSPTQRTPKQARGAWRCQNIRFADQTTVAFTLPRKVARLRVRGWLRGWSVRSVTPTRETDVACIEVSAPSHLYVTKDFLATHNTDEAGGRTGGKVMRKHRTAKDHIDGYIRPTYSEDDVTDKDKQDIIEAVNEHVDARVNQAVNDLANNLAKRLDAITAKLK